jgi:hypothetical protein
MKKKIRDNPALQTLLACLFSLLVMGASFYAIGPRDNFDSKIIYAIFSFSVILIVGPLTYLGTILLFFKSPAEMAADIIRKQNKQIFEQMASQIDLVSQTCASLKSRGTYSIPRQFSEQVEQMIPIVSQIIIDAESAQKDLKEKPSSELLDEIAAYLEKFNLAFTGIIKIMTGEIRVTNQFRMVDVFLRALSEEYQPAFKNIALKADEAEAADIEYKITLLSNLIKSRGRGSKKE